MNATLKKIIGGFALGLVILIVLAAVISAVVDQFRDGGKSESIEPQGQPAPTIAEP